MQVHVCVELLLRSVLDIGLYFKWEHYTLLVCIICVCVCVHMHMHTGVCGVVVGVDRCILLTLSLIHISEPTRLA